MIRIAKTLRDKYGFSVIPIKPDKKPLVKWEEFQKRQATDEEIEKWWADNPKALIGIVTGKVSGIAVIDVDSKDEKDIPLVFAKYTDIPTVSTPRGFHFYFKHQDGIANTVNVGGKKVDIRGEGGYVVAPPSKIGDKQYKWMFSLQKGLPEFPLEIFSEPGEPLRTLKPAELSGDLKFEEGRRDEDVFHVACNLVRSGMPEHEIRKVILQLHKSLPKGDRPFTEADAMRKVDSALKRDNKRGVRWEAETFEWVHNTTAWFPTTACYSDLGAFSVNDKSAIRNALKRLKDKKIIEAHATKSGFFRRMELECAPLDWQDAPTNDIDLIFPFDLQKKAKIYPGNIVVVAGYKDAGKTAFLLNFIKMNMDKHEIHYFSSEMGSSELKLRLGLFQDVKWNFKSWERNAHFDEVIHPNAINVIDYIEITDNHWMVGRYLQKIDAKLEDGIAVIALQKPYGRDIARGGESSLDKPRMYLAMNPGEIKIISIKNRRCTYNPNGEALEFKLFSGADFSDNGIWKKLEPKEKKPSK